MAAPIDMMGLIHKLTAEKFLKMIEEGVEVEETDKEGNVTVRVRPLTAAEWGVITGFLKANNITASVNDNDALRALQDKLTGKRKSIRPVFDDSDGAAVWQ